MTEPDVAITDYLLAVESLTFATLLIAQPAARTDLRAWFVVFFVATALASLLGGTVHGFFVARPSRLGRLLWRVTLLSIGISAAASWMIGAAVMWPTSHAGWILALVAAELIAYALIVFIVNDAFWVAAVNYAPATMFLIVACVVAYSDAPSGALASGIGGLVLTLLAGLGQRLRIGLHPKYFNHNAVFHVLHGIALFMIFRSAAYLIS